MERRVEIILDARQTKVPRYTNEGIAWDAVDFPSNDAVLALVEGSAKKRDPSKRRVGSTLPSNAEKASIGLLATIDDECLLVAGRPDGAASDAVTDDFHEGSARKLGDRLFAAFGTTERYSRTAKQARGASFAVAHYAGPVEYIELRGNHQRQ